MAQSFQGAHWKLVMCKELGRLTQGYMCQSDPQHSVKGTDTCLFIHRNDIPWGRKATYVCIVADYWDQKANPYRVCCPVGENLINFPVDKSIEVADIATVKCILNDVLSTPGTKWHA